MLDCIFVLMNDAAPNLWSTVAKHLNMTSVDFYANKSESEAILSTLIFAYDAIFVMSSTYLHGFLW